MGQFFVAGEQKIRPGVYQRHSNASQTNDTVALDGVNALVMRAGWGPVNTVTVHTTKKSVQEMYGSGDGVDAALAILDGGATKLHILRLSSNGENAGVKGKAVIGEYLTVTAKYQGDRDIKIKIQEKPGDSSKKQLLVVDGTTVKETYTVLAGNTEASLFASALKKSDYVTAESNEDGSITAAEIKLDGGKNPTVTVSDYVDGLYMMESYNYNVICTDSSDVMVAEALIEYVSTAVEAGKLVMAVVGQGSETEFEDRLNAAKDINSPYVVYLGNGYIDGDGNHVEGVNAVAYAAGLVSSTPSNQSVVHASISGAVDTIEKFTNAQYEQAITSGMLLLSRSSDGQVWFDSGVNTLTKPSEIQDDGWKKIKRTKVRIELMNRIDRILALKVGKINCDPDGIADVLQGGNGVLSDMVEERKLAAGARMYEDPENPYGIDSAWFIIEAYDIDTLEKIYLHYQFRYSSV